MIKNYNILYSLPFAINNGLLLTSCTALNSMLRARFFSSTSLLYAKHALDKVDRLDSFLNSMSPEDLSPVRREDFPSKKVQSKIYGLHSYLFSSKMVLSIRGDEFEEKMVLVVNVVESFLKSLDDNTVYKCLFIGVTDEGDIKSSTEGAFFISKNTRVDYIVMKVKNGIKQFAFRYKGLDFDSWTLCYKKWIPTSLIGEYIHDAEKVLDKISERELLKNMRLENKEDLDLMLDHDISHYTRWVKLVGVIEKYGPLYSDQYLVEQTRTKNGDYKVVVECLDNAESVSWVDAWVSDDGKSKWVRKFSDGVYVYYEGDRYLMFEAGFKTEFWEKDLKEYEYDKNFGSLDIETYSEQGIHGDGLQIPYAAGFKDSGGRVELFYVQKGEGDYMVLVRMIEALLVSRRHGSTFYVHNLARFDSRLILEALGLMKDVSARLWGRDMHNIFKIRLRKKIGKKYFNVVLLDSFYLLPFELNLLGNKFNTDVKKTVFPYAFVRCDNLFYKGVVPPLTDYGNKIEMSDYMRLREKSWDLKAETLKYLTNDLECLYEVMHKYNSAVHCDFLVNAVKLSSYSALSKKIYITNYYPMVGIKIPVISGHLEAWIRRAYKGGIVDVVQHMVVDAVKYDSNSHYPAAMLNFMPVGVPRMSDCKNLNNIFGFCYVEVTAPSEDELLCPILPTTDENGDLHCPRGVWKDVYFSEELKNAVQYGYKVKVLSAVVFDKGAGLFDEFIKEMFKRKADAKEIGDAVGELLYKLTQNSLYGKSGQKEIIHSFDLMDNEKVDTFEFTHKTDLQQKFGGKTLVRTQGKIDADLIGVVTKAMSQKESLYASDSDNMNDEEPKDLPTPSRKKGSVKSSVSIAAAITAYARIMISQYKNIEGNKYLGGDTDSAIMQKELSPKLVGKGLGMMKEECRVAVGLFADKKLYYMQDEKGVSIIKSRGVGRDRERNMDILCYNDFVKLFRGEELKIHKKKFLIKNDGIYLQPQLITVKISTTHLLKIQAEANDILTHIFHPLYLLAAKIGRTDIKALTIHNQKFACLIVVSYDFHQVNHGLILFKCGKNNLTPFVLYVTGNGLVLTHEQFSCKIYAGIIQYIFYVDKKNVSLDYQQFHSKINYDLIVYNRTQQKELIYSETSIAPVIFVTPSRICLFSNDPRTNFIFINYKMRANSKKVMFKRAMILYNCNRLSIIDNYPFVSRTSRKEFVSGPLQFLRFYTFNVWNCLPRRRTIYLNFNKNIYITSYNISFTAHAKQGFCLCNLRCVSYSSKDLKDIVILKPISSVKLLAPLVFNDNIMRNIKQCDIILSTLPNNTVKKFLIEELNDKKIIVCAEVKKELINNYMEKVARIPDYNQNDWTSPINKTIYRHDIREDDNGYNTPWPLTFKQALYIERYILNPTHSLFNKNSDFDKFKTGLDIGSLWNNEKLINKNVERVNHKQGWKIKCLEGGITYFYGNRFKLRDFNGEWDPVSKQTVNSELLRYMSQDIEPYLAGCYVIIFDNILYFYIGSSINLVDRAKYHRNNLRNIIKKIPLSTCRYNTFIDHFLESEILYKGFLTYNLLPLYFCCNYLNKFKSLYPEYRLSKGELILLSSITDLTIKFLVRKLLFNCLF